MDDELKNLALIIIGFVAAFFVLGEVGFYRTLGLTPQEGLGWLLGPLIRSPVIVVALGILVVVAYLAGRFLDDR